MAEDFPYMVNAGNIPAILEKIQAAGTPPRFTLDFLRASLGFKSSNDRSAIAVLKRLGMLSPSGDPTSRYNEFKDPRKSGAVIAAGLREGWDAIFLADQEAYKKTQAELKGLFQSLSGKSEKVSELMARTFKNLADLADWDATVELDGGEEPGIEPPPEVVEEETTHEAPESPEDLPERQKRREAKAVTLHNDIHVHLPTSPDVAVYTAIFRALREELLDE